MSAVWSDEQRRCLAALGYELYRPSTAPETDAATLNVATRVGATPLLSALLRAALCDPTRIADMAGWLHAQQIPSLQQLRGDPIAKRALWPRLRALRRVRASR